MAKFRFGLVCLLGIILIVLGARQMVNESKKPIDILDPDYDFSELEDGDHVKIDVDFIMDAAAVRKKDGKITSQMYCLPHLNDDNEIDGFVGLQISNSSDYVKLDNMVNDSVAYYTGNSNHRSRDSYRVDGVVRVMKSEEVDLFEDYIDDCDMDSGDLVSMVIVPSNNTGSILLIMGAVITLIGGTVLFFLIRRDIKLKNEASESASEYADASF